MKDTVIIQGNTDSEKWEHLEIVLKRMFRRLNHTVVGIMPKIPVMNYVKDSEDGFLGRFLVPSNGILETFDAYVGLKQLDDSGDIIEPTFKILIKRGLTEISNVVDKDKLGSSINVNMSVQPDDIIEIYTDKGISFISFSMLFSFDESSSNAQQVMISKIEQLALDHINADD
jgi:hypothetical protein